MLLTILLPSLSAVAPTFTQDVAPTNVTFPANLTLTCTATARPRPNITWYKDGAELMESDQVSITSKEDGERVLESTLTVTSPFLDRIGNYTCMAENVVDTASSTAEVMIFCESLLYIAFIQYLPLCCTHFLFTLSHSYQFLVTTTHHPLSTSSTHIPCAHVSHCHCLPLSPLLPPIQPNPSSEIPQWT